MQFSKPWIYMGVPITGALLILGGCNNSKNSNTNPPATIPLKLGEVISNSYDGVTDGLLAALGLTGIQGSGPSYADPMNPTKEELRRHTLYLNYTALVDKTDAGGFGRIYGPMDDTTFAGKEYLAFVGEGLNRATLMVQIPDSFNPKAPCIVAAASSGSRGVYGAVATSGSWGLEKGCAIAYTDANKGTGAVDLSQKKGFGLQMEPLGLNSEAELSFRVPTQSNVTSPSEEYAGVTLPTAVQLEEFIAANPNRYAFKHAHSQKNIEKDWGLHTLQAIKFAFQQLNETYAETITPDNTLVIAASVSNGGAAAIRAAEQDSESLIDAVVVGEPNINPKPATEPFSIKMGDSVVMDHSKPAYEYFALAELYAACASKAPENAGALFAELRGSVEPRCDALVAAGLLTDGTYEEEGTQAQAKLNAAGFLPESNKLLVGYAGIDLFQSLLATYGNAYTRSSVVDSLCHVSMAHVPTGTLTPGINDTVATLSATSNGIPRTSNIYLIKDDAMGGPTLQILASSNNGTADYNAEGALCWYDLYMNAANPLHVRLKQGIEEVKANGDLQGKPTIIVHGRSDALIPVNHSSRPYYVLNQQKEGADSKLRYYEVKNSQHLDSLNQLYASVGMNYVPIDYYFKQAMDLMYEHLTNGTILPPSQVVNAHAPVGNLQQADLPDINVMALDLITIEDGNLVVPE